MPSVEAIANTMNRWSALTPGEDCWSSDPAAEDWALRVGLAEVIVKVAAPEGPPPDAALDIETFAVPIFVTSLAGICALAVVVLVAIVGVIGTPFQ
jgi:hypothetical protein